MGDHHHGPAKGLTRWITTTNHKDIGTMYLWFSFSMFILGGAFAMIVRAELFQPGMQLIEPAFFNQMTTLHGLIMVFGAIMPSFVLPVLRSTEHQTIICGPTFFSSCFCESDLNAALNIVTNPKKNRGVFGVETLLTIYYKDQQ
jgi:hypothetical protein